MNCHIHTRLSERPPPEVSLRCNDLILDDEDRRRSWRDFDRDESVADWLVAAGGVQSAHRVNQQPPCFVSLPFPFIFSSFALSPSFPCLLFSLYYLLSIHSVPSPSPSHDFKEVLGMAVTSSAGSTMETWLKLNQFDLVHCIHTHKTKPCDYTTA